MKKRILAIDDDKVIAGFTKSYLERFDFDVDIAMQIEEINKCLLNNYYDLMLLDINMPFFSGYDIIKIKRMIHNSTPVMLLTNVKKPEKISECVKTISKKEICDLPLILTEYFTGNANNHINKESLLI